MDEQRQIIQHLTETIILLEQQITPETFPQYIALRAARSHLAQQFALSEIIYLDNNEFPALPAPNTRAMTLVYIEDVALPTGVYGTITSVVGEDMAWFLPEGHTTPLLTHLFYLAWRHI